MLWLWHGGMLYAGVTVHDSEEVSPHLFSSHPQSSLLPTLLAILLQGSPILAATASLAQKVKDEYSSLESGLFSRFPHLFPRDIFTFERFEWAFSILFSRAINVRELDMLALVPYADLLNHNPYCAATFLGREASWWGGNEKGEVVLYSDRTYNRMDQIFVSYGQKSNSELLLLYGFVVDRNMFDQVDLLVGLSEEDPRYEEKKRFLLRQGLKPELTFPLLPDRYTVELLQYLRLCTMTPEDGPLDAADYAEPVSVRNERAALEAIEAACSSALAAYPQDEMTDARIMGDPKLWQLLTKKQRDAVKLRRNEKTVLKRTITAVRAEIAALNI